MSSSLWGFDTRATDDGNQSIAFYQKDVLGFDVGAVLAATRNELPLFDSSRLTPDAYLGSGTSFDVHRELFLHAAKTPEYYVAVKYVKMAAHSPEANRQRFRNVIREIRVMMHPSLRNHKCIIPLLAYGWKNDLVLGSIPYIITQYSSYGTLRTWLQNRYDTAGERQDLAMDVALAIAALHAEGIIHGDVKLENVLVFGNSGPDLDPEDDDYIRQWERNFVAKLADFGSVSFAGRDVLLHSYAGTPIYNAPELQDWFLQNKLPRAGLSFEDCLRLDVYSFGLLLWEVMNQGKQWFWEIPEFDETEGPITLLERLYTRRSNELREYATRWAIVRRLLHPDDAWSDATKDAVKAAVQLCLHDAAVQRADMREVIAGLAKGTSTKRRPPTYPLPREGPRIENDRIGPDRIPAPYGYYVTEEAPDIAIPNNQTKSPYLRRYSTFSGEWELTTEIEHDRFHDRFYNLQTASVYAPESVERAWVNPQSFDQFEAAAAMSPPWEVQCEIVRKLKEDVLRETDHDKKAQAHLQLSLCLHIGFGVMPDASKVVFHLQEAAACGNVIANTMQLPVRAAFRDCSISGVTESREHKSGNDTYLSRAQSCVLAKMPNMLASLDSCSSVPAHHRVLMQDMLRACQEVSFGDAITLAKRCCSVGVCWSLVWPTPVHWLFMFASDQAEAILDQLLVSSPMVDFERSSQKTVYIPELALELLGSPLMWAARLGDVGLTSLLLDRGANVDFTWRRHLRQEDGVTPKDSLHYSSVDLATIWHHTEVLRVLLERGASLQGGGPYESHSASALVACPVRPLARQVVHGARSRNALKETLGILAQYDRPSSVRSNRMLEVAFAHCDQDLYILEELLACRHAADHLSGQFLVVAVKDAPIRRCTLTRLNVALPLVRDVNFVDEAGKTALQYAAEANSAVLVERLLSDRRVDYNTVVSKLPHPIALAAQVGAEGVVDLLIDAGVDPDAADQTGLTPLQHALASRSAMMAARLIDAGAVLHFTTGALLNNPLALRTTALFLATSSQQDSNSVLAPLLRACPRLQDREMLNFRNDIDWTVLHQAVWYGDAEGVYALLEAGADRSHRSSNGLPTKRRTGTPLEMAVRLSDDLRGLGIDGWKQSTILWLSKGGVMAWQSYLARLESIIGALQREVSDRPES